MKKIILASSVLLFAICTNAQPPTDPRLIGLDTFALRTTKVPPSPSQKRTSIANSDSLAVQRAAAAFIEAFNNLDWERFRHSFSNDATMFFPSPSGQSPRRANGRDEIEARFKPGFEEIRKSKPKSTIPEY